MRERKLLQTWKEICGHLKVDLRTAQRWEKQGMPVWGTGRRFAFSDQLDFWFENGRRRLEPVAARLSENDLTAYYYGDQSLWTYTFSDTLLPETPEEASWPIHIGPLRNRPGRCVLVAGRFQPPS